MSPERNLWCAVLNKTLSDFEQRLKSIKRLKRKGGFRLRGAVIDLDQLWNEVRSEWFLRICEMANVPANEVIRYIRKMHIKHGLGEYIRGIKGLQ